jgi:hypothetical protein
MEQRIRFGEWSMTNPNYEPLHDALHNARYNLKNLTQSQAYLICSAAEDYLHLVAHPASTKSIIDQLKNWSQGNGRISTYKMSI